MGFFKFVMEYYIEECVMYFLKFNFIVKFKFYIYKNI